VLKINIFNDNKSSQQKIIILYLNMFPRFLHKTAAALDSRSISLVITKCYAKTSLAPRPHFVTPIYHSEEGQTLAACFSQLGAVGAPDVPPPVELALRASLARCRS
jgi:hypothetical protein